ncbi:MAG: yehT 2, partial [Paenibacillaceae bacterium]|nr:yehT 2 [Paenibacillaceae bacterium]
MIRAYLVDDEQHALNILDIFLRRIEGVEVVGRAGNAYEAIDGVKATRPDVVFLDIEMPGMYGIELAEIIKNSDMGIHIVFLTAYDRYAVSAFEQEALDYILKPLEMERLHRTIQRVQKEMAKTALPADQEGNAPAGHPPVQPRLYIRVLGDLEAYNERGERLKWRTAKVKELLAYLAVHGQTRVMRDRILNDLW